MDAPASLTPRQQRALLARDIEVGVIPALSIRQPWPHRIFHEDKDVENRDWLTRYRGWFLVHAGVTTEECAPSEMHLPRGGIVGLARIVDCVTSMESRWFFGRFGFVLRDAEPLPLVACRGKLGFFYPPAEVNVAVAGHVRAGVA